MLKKLLFVCGGRFFGKSRAAVTKHATNCCTASLTKATFAVLDRDQHIENMSKGDVVLGCPGPRARS